MFDLLAAAELALRPEQARHCGGRKQRRKHEHTRGSTTLLHISLNGTPRRRFTLSLMKLLTRSLGLMMVLDGVSALISPREYPRQLEIGLPVIDDVLEYFAERPELTRGVSVAEIALGAWLIVR